MSIEARKKQILENLQRYPALGIELNEKDINYCASANIISLKSLTEHQKAACRIASDLTGWHPCYIAENIISRPSLFRQITDLAWETKAKVWQSEHDMSVSDLAIKYKKEFLKVADRLYEPIEKRKEDGVIISCYDIGNGKDPCLAMEW
jgi:hypothetical protein